MLAMRSRAWSVALCLVAALSACSSRPARLHYGINDAPEGRRLMWPPEPEIPRYQFSGQLTGEDNFVHDEGEGLMQRFFRWVTGLGEETPRELQRPQAVVGDEKGRIFVTDVSRAAVFVFDEPAGELRIWEYASGLRRFVSPIGIVADPDGSIWVADAELGIVAHLDRDGTPLAAVGKGMLKRPTGLARDPDSGEIFVSDTYGHDIKVFSPTGELLRTIGGRGSEPGLFNYPTHIYIANGELFVTDTMNARVQIMRLDEAGEPRALGRRGLYIGNLVRPKGVAADREGNIYVVESLYDNLLIFNDKGEFLMPIGGVGQGTGKFYLPSGVWVDDLNRVFVADTFNGRVTIFQYLGNGIGNGG